MFTMKWCIKGRGRVRITLLYLHYEKKMPEMVLVLLGAATQYLQISEFKG